MKSNKQKNLFGFSKDDFIVKINYLFTNKVKAWRKETKNHPTIHSQIYLKH